MSVIKGLQESSGETKTTMTVVGGDGSVKKINGVRRKAGAGGRSTIVEMFAKAVTDRTGQTPSAGDSVSQ